MNDLNPKRSLPAAAPSRAPRPPQSACSRQPGFSGMDTETLRPPFHLHVYVMTLDQISVEHFRPPLHCGRVRKCLPCGDLKLDYRQYAQYKQP